MTERSYTNIEQSKEVAKFLPLESADMHYNNVSVHGMNYVDPHHVEIMSYNEAVKTLSDYTKVNPMFEVLPCWSLGALLKNLPEEIEHEGIKYQLWLSMQDLSYYSVEYDVYLCCTEGEPINACIEMYKELKKRDLI